MAETMDAKGLAQCTHCGLPVPGERRSSQFCCAGCEVVHGLLRDEGLLRFYDLGGQRRGAIGDVPRAATFDWLPDLEAAAGDAPTVRLVLDVQGIRCAACIWLLQTLWRRQPGARDLRVDPSLGRAVLLADRGSPAVRAFLAAAARFGYQFAPASRQLARDTGVLTRLGICAAIAMNAMILAVSLYFGLGEVTAASTAGDAALRPLFGWVLTGLGTLSLLIGGPVFFRGAIAGLRIGVVHMDLPISLGLLMAWGGSVYGQLTGGATWFDTVSLFVAFMLGGRFLQQRTLAQSRDQVLADDGAEHMRARRLDGGEVKLVPVLQLRAGDELLLAPGDLVPVRLRPAAASTFSLDWIDGESEPRSFAAGSAVPAGAFHAGRAAVRGEVLADFASSGLADLLGQDPPDREDTRGRVRFWDRLNRSYAVGVLLAAALGAAIWAAIDPTQSLPVAISVLVITCPCAMGIAVPLAFHLALAQLRRQGVFVRSKSLLDKARVVRKVVFDKTGTVTHGGLRAVGGGALADDVVPVLATMVASSNHPVSQAVLQALPRAPFRAGVELEEVTGQGLRAVVDGVEWRLGGRSFAGVPAAAMAAREVVLARNGVLVASFRLEEDFRAGAADEVAWLRARGIEVHLLSGDREDRVARAAEALGIAPGLAHGGMSPADKARAIEALDRGDLMMVGDGLNDAPAFAAAFCAGTPAMDRPVLPARADFCFRSAAAGAVRSVFEAADLHGRVVRTNLALALVYNTSTLVTCFLAAMTPVLCAVLMPLSSIALVLHTAVRFQRARRRLGRRSA
ncbi:MAG: heavy metal translocating P-type ATPase metal-binding domain-containing protein [Planctomycetes bacterium]|nr:heavy metal translocating P-type ATPase metal-binding domain-containing protein [Planctomycetota bacterium]